MLDQKLFTAVFLLYILLLNGCINQNADNTGRLNTKVEKQEYKCKEWILPAHTIHKSFCNANVRIEFSGGYPWKEVGYTFKWSNGVTTLDNSRIQDLGNYYLTVTDDKGCTTVGVFEVDVNEPTIPIINNVSVREVFCEKESISLNIEYNLPRFNYQTSIKPGLNCSFIHPVTGEFIEYELNLNKEGIDSISLFDLPIGVYQKPLKFTPYSKEIKSSLVCKGEPFYFDLSPFALPNEYFNTKLEISKRESPDCNYTEGYFLDGYCGSSYGCLLKGDEISEKTIVPFGDFEYTINTKLGSNQYSIIPLLHDDLTCLEEERSNNNLSVTSFISKDDNPVIMAGCNWIKAEECNCYRFVLLDSLNNNVSIKKSKFSVEGSTVKQTSPNTALVCISKEGLHCVSVMDKYGCAMDYCKEDLKFREIEYETIVNFVPSTRLREGDVFVFVDKRTKLPVTWDADTLKNKIKSVDDSSIHLGNLVKGNYSVTVSDGNGCTQEIDIELNNGGIASPRKIILTEGKNDQSSSIMPNAKWIKPSVLYQGNALETKYDFALWMKIFRDASIYEWTGPDGFKSNDHIIFPKLPGTYCLNIIPINYRRKKLGGCYKFSVTSN